MKDLVCGCCDDGFRGIQTPEHDTGYGTCEECVGWLDEENEQQFKCLEDRVTGALNEKNRADFLTMKQQEKRGVILEMIDRGIIKFTSGMEA